MTGIELIGVPFDGFGRDGNQAAASAVLREEGLVDAFAGHDVRDAGDVALPGFETTRSRVTGLVNEPALTVMVDLVRQRVAEAVGAGRFPVVYGADCTTLLGSVPGLRDATGGAGLLFVDGHEDTMPLDVSEDGEAANTEVGLLLGLTGRTLRGPLAQSRNALTAGTIAVLGPRDGDWRRRFNVGTVADLGVWCRTADELGAGSVAAATEAATVHLRQQADRWWFHVDLDVVDPEEFPAQGLPDVPDEPGGLTWSQLRELAATAARQPGCAGWSLAIYDPEQDPTRDGARQIVRLAREVAGVLRS